MTADTKINTILQCFVDINLETNENSAFSLDLLDVSFSQSSHTINEGQIVELNISLSSPSVNGYEEVEIGVVANNTSILDFDNLGETYPRTLLFSAGQQSHTIKFLANNDFIEESTESFDVILGFFTNTNPGKYITSRVNIVDQTNLKEVFINDEGGFIQTSTITNFPTLTFSSIEGSSKEIKISLDSPSVFGIETASMQFTNNTTNNNDYSIIGSTNFSWAIGEQDKFFKIKTIQDNLIEATEVLEMEIISTTFANIKKPSKAEFKIFDDSPEKRFVNVNLQGIYTQIGGFNFQNITSLRNILNNTEINNSSSDETMLLKFGETFKSIIKTSNNSPSVSVCGNNCIRKQIKNTYEDTVYFGKNPSTGEYGDVKLIITSQGQFPVIINGNQINPGQSVVFNIDSFNYNITLPTNSNLIQGGTTVGNILFSDDTLTEAVYGFVIESRYSERQFVLKDIPNNIVTNNKINLGVHTFKESYDFITASATTNQHNLVTTYNQVLTNWDTFPGNTGLQTCVPLSEYISNNHTFPSNDSEAISIANGVGHAMINGIAILSDNSEAYSQIGVGSGPSAYDESTYVNVKFLPSGQTINSTCPSIIFPITPNKTSWETLQFEIIP